MIRPRQEHIAHFQDYTPDNFASWLQVGLEGLHIKNLGVRDFKPLEYCVLVEHTLAGDLAIIYKGFSGHQQAMIKEAIARLIARLPAEPGYVPIFQDLLSFALKVKAYEILRTIPAKGERFLALEPQDPEVETLYSRAINAVVELSESSDEAFACIDRLIGTPDAFSFEHARAMLFALCKTAPKDFSRHMARMRESLTRNFLIYRPAHGVIEHFIQDIEKAIGLVDIERSWHELKIVERRDDFDLDEPEEPNDNWFRDGLVARLEIRDEDRGTRILTLKERPDTSVLVTDIRHYSSDTSRISEASRAEELQNTRDRYGSLPDQRISQEEETANSYMLQVLFGTSNISRRTWAVAP